MSRTGGEILVDQLIQEGVDTVFGVPGIQLDYAVDGLAQHTDDIAFISARHEQGAAYMADGYARVGEKPGVCMVVPGPGLLNAGAALSTAYATNSRMVCIVGQIPSAKIGEELGMLHEIRDQSALLGSLTKWSARAETADDIPGLVNEAFRQVQSGRPRPVGIEIPPDILKEHTDGLCVDAAVAMRTAPDAAAVSQVAQLLRNAQRPVIVAGGGVRDRAASRALQAIAERLGAPVVKTRNGKGALSDRHPLVVSRLGGAELLKGADVIFAVGTRFVTMEGKPVVLGGGRKIITLNADPNDTRAPRQFDAVLIGDAQLGLEALAEELPQRSTYADLDRVRTWEQGQLARLAPQLGWLTAIRSALPDDGVLIEELTQVGYAARLAYPVYEPATYVTPGYQGTLGYGFPTGLGAQVGKRGSQVVSINGDGGFGWSLQELSTAAKYGIGLVTVVFNNGAFGNVQRIQTETFGRNLGVELHNPDYAALSSAFGVAYEHIDQPDGLAAAIRNAAGSHEPLLIEIPLGDVPTPWPLLAEPAIEDAS